MAVHRTCPNLFLFYCFLLRGRRCTGGVGGWRCTGAGARRPHDVPKAPAACGATRGAFQNFLYTTSFHFLFPFPFLFYLGGSRNFPAVVFIELE